MQRSTPLWSLFVLLFFFYGCSDNAEPTVTLDSSDPYDTLYDPTSEALSGGTKEIQWAFATSTDTAWTIHVEDTDEMAPLCDEDTSAGVSVVAGTATKLQLFR